MPVVVCDSSPAAVVNAALRESLGNSIGGGGVGQKQNGNNGLIGGNNIHHSHSAVTNNFDESDSIQNRIVATTKRVFFGKIEYEEVDNYSQSVLEHLKTKYSALKPLTNNNNNNNNNNNESGNAITSTATTSSSGKLNLLKPQLQQQCGDGNDKETINVQQNGQKQRIHTINTNNPNELPLPKKILFPRENVQIGWRNSSRKWQVGAGMINVGNTCYLNSTLQAIFHVSAMANWLLSDAAHREKCADENGSQDGCIICAMSKTLISSQQGQTAIRPWPVFTKLRLICKHLVMGRQEDSHEFLRYLVEAMEKSYLQRYRNYKELDQYSKETTPLNQILGGYLRSAVRCLACGHVSTTFQHFQDLLLDIRKANAIEEALDLYFARERLEDMGYKCESCKKKVSATKQFSLERAPISLCIQLKRFSMMGTKLTKHIQFKPRLDLTKYSSKKSNAGGIGCGIGDSLTYKLMAMVTHLGASQHCGHYTAIGCTESGSYYQFDDSCVRPISLQNVLNTNAYIIFYELDQNQKLTASTQVSGSLENEKLNGHSSSIAKPFANNGYNNNNVNNTVNICNNNSNNNSNSNNASKLNENQRIIGPQLPHPTENLPHCSNNLQSNKNILKINVEQKAQQCSSKVIHVKNQINSNEKELTTNGKIEEKTTKHVPATIASDVNQQQKQQLPKFSGIIKIETQNSTTFKAKTDDSLSNQKNCETLNKKTTKSSISLPSMPNIAYHNENEFTNTASNTVGQTSNVDTKNCTKPTNYLHNANSCVKNSSNPLAKLIPYGSDESDGETSCTNTTNGNISNRRRNNSVDSDDNDENCSSPDSKSAKSTPPTSPYCIETNAGIWKVTNLNKNNEVKKTDSSLLKSTTPMNQQTPEKRSCNPFNTGSNTASTLNFYSGSYKTTTNKDPTVNELLKLSHRGYGTTVLNWNGQKTEMDKELEDEVRLQRKRELQVDEENELDRGRQKKIKLHNNGNHRDVTPGFNPFQEMQRKNNHDHQRRWVNGRFQHNQNSYYRNNNNNNYFNRNHNNNFNKKFNKYHNSQRTNHHQRKWR